MSIHNCSDCVELQARIATQAATIEKARTEIDSLSKAIREVRRADEAFRLSLEKLEVD